MSESEPIPFRQRNAGAHSRSASASGSQRPSPSPVVAFQRQELDAILAVYARYVAAGEWRDYALDMGREKAVFAIFQRACEYPLYRIEKCPKLARRQGAYSVVTRTGHVLKRGHDLKRVLSVLDGLKLIRT